MGIVFWSLTEFSETSRVIKPKQLSREFPGKVHPPVPLLGFKRQFAGFVREGSKQHTIRAKRKFPVKPGDICHCYVDPRQRTMALLGRWVCTRVQDAIIRHPDPSIPVLEIEFDGELLSPTEARDFLYIDGFRNYGREGAMILASEFWRKPMIAAGGIFYSDLVHWKYDYPGERR